VKLNLGCGSRPEPGWVNLDSVAQPGVDVVHDLDAFPWPFEDGEAEEIRAFDVYEHVNHPLEFMAECHRVLHSGGLLFIHTSYWKNRCSYTDPTHKRFLTEDSFDYWVPGTQYHARYGPAYARGCAFMKEQIWLDTPDGDLNVQLRRY
jgi:SAM-dependent methyltransferase